MKTNKIKLESLKVESFVTNLKENEQKTVQGGGPRSNSGCLSNYGTDCCPNKLNNTDVC